MPEAVLEAPPRRQKENDEFFRTVDRADALLQFLIAERHPYHVPDSVIDEIEHALDFPRDADPGAEERAKLIKAYRDLVAIPQSSVSFDRIPPARFWRSRWVLALILITGLPSGTWELLAHLGLVSESYWYLPIIYALLSGWMVWGSYVFSGVVTDGKLDQAVRFCYAFTIVALVTSVLPFCVPGLIPSTSAPVGLLYGCVSGTGTDATGARINSEVRCGEQHQSQWLFKIGGGAVDPTKTSQPQSGSLSPPTLEEWQIHGGMVVPLYVVVLALFGAAVSMTRRVPEYQRQAMNARNPVTNQQAREDLVLQIMQVVSAPVLATIAYYIFNPGDQMQTVLIGFASGFASEPILRNIRGLVEKLSPEPAGGPGAIRGPIAVRVTPPGVHLKPGNAIQFSSQVSGSENAEVIWKIERIANIDADKTGTISQSGYYSSPSARPTGVETVTVTAASAADRTKSGSATVTLET